jgi:hypothetical protein
MLLCFGADVAGRVGSRGADAATVPKAEYAAAEAYAAGSGRAGPDVTDTKAISTHHFGTPDTSGTQGTQGTSIAAGSN